VMQSGIEVPLPTNDNRIGLMMTTRCHGEKFSLYAKSPMRSLIALFGVVDLEIADVGFARALPPTSAWLSV
jgi:hypothetical protein